MNKALLLLILAHVLVSSESIAGSGGFGAVFDTNVPIYFEGSSRTAVQWKTAKEQCKNSTKIRRGEYETKQEFEIRKSNLVQGCQNLDPLRGATIKTSVELRYDNDRNLFRFSLPMRPGSASGCGGRSGGYTTNCMKQMTFSGDKTFDYSDRYFDGMSSLNIQESRASGLIHEFTWEMKAGIDKARSLKVKESSLEFIIEGTLHSSDKYYDSSKVTVQKYVFDIEKVKLVDRETDRTILVIK